jgi:hypothetical protein
MLYTLNHWLWNISIFNFTLRLKTCSMLPNFYGIYFYSKIHSKEVIMQRRFLPHLIDFEVISKGFLLQTATSSFVDNTILYPVPLYSGGAISIAAVAKRKNSFFLGALTFDEDVVEIYGIFCIWEMLLEYKSTKANKDNFVSQPTSVSL